MSNRQRTTTGQKGASTVGSECLNCGAMLSGRYCASCGQNARRFATSFKALLSDYFESILSLDSRFLLTIKRLLFNPGELSIDYLGGKQARYMSPIKTYLIFSFVYFLIAAWVGSESFLVINIDGDEQGLSEEFLKWLPRFMFVVIPGFALILMGLFRKARQYYAEHLVFALHLHAAWFFLFTVQVAVLPLENIGEDFWLSDLSRIVSVVVSGFAKLYMLAYTFFALRRFYQNSTARILVKGLGLLVGYVLVLGAIVFLFLFLRGF